MLFYSCDNEYLNYCHYAPPWPHQYKPCFPSQLNKYCLFSCILSPYMATVPKLRPQGCCGNKAFCDRLHRSLLWNTETRGSKWVSYNFRGSFLLQMSGSPNRMLNAANDRVRYKPAPSTSIVIIHQQKRISLMPDFVQA